MDGVGPDLDPPASDRPSRIIGHEENITAISNEAQQRVSGSACGQFESASQIATRKDFVELRSGHFFSKLHVTDTQVP